MASFLSEEQRELAAAIAARLVERGETVAVAEGTAGGLISAALLSVPGASRYYIGGGVLYTRGSRIALAGVTPEQYAEHQGSRPELLTLLAEAMRQRLEATWCIAETGLAGPTGGGAGAPAGRTAMAVAGPVERAAVIETGLSERETNMVEFTTHSLRFLLDAIQEAGEEH